MAEQTKQYAIRCHRETNHLYDDQPYEIHLQMVVEAAERFIHLIPEEDRNQVIAGCWVHDCIEDCRQTYNDVKKATSETVAELAYALTNEKGRNRQERANDKYYADMKATPFAVFIKYCDRIANVTYSKKQGNRMFGVYKKEVEGFIAKIHQAHYDEMADYLRSLFEN
ncbi:phosphohydrolase [marine bacterium AO1-C]|nr:phosphohydrolase [marine bacterium AO1-C]